MQRYLVGFVVVPVLGLVAAARPVHREAPHREAPHREAVAVQRPGVSPEVVKAQQELEGVEKRLRGEFEKGDEYVKAEGDLKQAQGEYEAAVKAAVDKVKEKPEYAAAVEALKKVEEEQLAYRLNPGATVDPALATRLMDAKMAVHKMEMDAGDTDPAAKEEKGKVLAARGVVNGLRGKFEASMRQDADWQAAKKALDDARAAARGK
jgi:hypothetical protein